MEVKRPVHASRNLTPREVEILQMVLCGESYDAVAKRIFRGKALVKYHVHAIFRKFDVHSRSMLIHKAMSSGLIYTDNKGNRSGVKLKFIAKIFSDASKENSDQGQTLQGETSKGAA